MEANLNKVIIERIKRTITALNNNNYKATYVPTGKEALALVKTLVESGQTVAMGGSVTLAQTEITEFLTGGQFEVIKDAKESHCAKTYFSSSNAITESGFLVNADGRSNRTSCILNGPENVIIVAGYNKIVPDVESGIRRIKTVAAPANAIRLGCDTYCAKHGVCVNCVNDKENLSIPDSTACSNTICCNYVISGSQRVKDRITVIIVGEELGY